MDNVQIIDNFFDADNYEKIKEIIFNACWVKNLIERDIYYGKKDPPYWTITLTDFPFFSVILKNIIEETFNKKFKLIRVYALSQYYEENGSFHIDNIKDTRFTFCLYINPDIPSDPHGTFLIRIPNINHIMSIEPISNRGVLFPANYRHKGNSFNRDVNSLRICITWKMDEIK